MFRRHSAGYTYENKTPPRADGRVIDAPQLSYTTALPRREPLPAQLLGAQSALPHEYLWLLPYFFKHMQTGKQTADVAICLPYKGECFRLPRSNGVIAEGNIIQTAFSYICYYNVPEKKTSFTRSVIQRKGFNKKRQS